jgi:hypothetical protein
LATQEEAYQWLAVIGRSLAYLCLQAGELKDKQLADKAKFLLALGVDRKEAAGMLGTTYGSVSETLSRVSRKRKGAKIAQKTKRNKGK